MDISILTKSVVKYIFPFIAKNKTIKKIGEEISEAANNSLDELWEKVKPIFIEEYEEDGVLNEYVESQISIEKDIHKMLKKASQEDVDTIAKTCEQLDQDEASGKLKSLNINVSGDDNIVITDTTNSQININQGKK